MLALLALFFATMPIARRRQFRLAQTRRPIDAAGFERGMAAEGVSPTTSRFLWKELHAFYYHPLTPQPGDRLESLILIDRTELEGLVTRFWMAMRGGDARPAGTLLGPDPTIAEIGRHCDLLAGWTRGSA